MNTTATIVSHNGNASHNDPPSTGVFLSYYWFLFYLLGLKNDDGMYYGDRNLYCDDKISQWVQAPGPISIQNINS